ncbi:hypothetical protein GCM10020367_10440 [Streptomyces sannanensis]|uniref:Uncharacterized protein n=1 Tax=Streptomyces sannanensis TaxID=285536 RepID=A0ABP6S622_9ACTN
MYATFARMHTSSDRSRSAAASWTRRQSAARFEAPMPTGIQPSARSTSRRSARGLEAGRYTGMGLAGFGPTTDGAMVVSSPSYDTGSGPRGGYEDNVLCSGLPSGSPEECLDCACGLYLDGPAARPLHELLRRSTGMCHKAQGC